MMKKLGFLALTLATLTFAACSKSGSENTPEPTREPALVSVKLEGTTSRADGTPEDGVGIENQVNIIEFYVFESDGSADAAYPYFSKSTALSSASTFLVTEGTNKRFLVAVNQELGTPAVGTTYTQMKEQIEALTLTAANAQATPAASPGFAMSGEGEKTIVAGLTNSLTITVQRLLSRVEAPVVQSGGANVTAISSSSTALEELFGSGVTTVTDLAWAFDGYAVINGINKSYSFEHVAFADWNPAGKAWETTTYSGDGATITSAYSGSTGATDYFLPAAYENSVYVYENSPEKSSTEAVGEGVTFKADQVTAFLIKGTFSADGQTPATRYWRVNLIKDDVWKVYRNSIYRITMEKILTAGYVTPKEAETDELIVDPDQSTISINLSISPWNVKLQGVDL